MVWDVMCPTHIMAWSVIWIDWIEPSQDPVTVASFAEANGAWLWSTHQPDERFHPNRNIIDGGYRRILVDILKNCMVARILSASEYDVVTKERWSREFLLQIESHQLLPSNEEMLLKPTKLLLWTQGIFLREIAYIILSRVLQYKRLPWSFFIVVMSNNN